MIAKYFKKVENNLDENSHFIEDFLINKQTFTKEKGTIEGEVFFNDESRMDFMEAVNTSKKGKDKYSYHYMDKEKEMIFRYDNAKHHREIKTFPHHKHTPKGIIESSEPNLNQILGEVEKNIMNEH